MAAPMGRLILQADWSDSFREAGGKSWITYKLHNLPSVNGELECQGLSADGVPYVMGSDGFAVSDITKKCINVTFSDECGSVSRKFVSPIVSFSTIHRENKTVNCIDVTSGGLGVSSDTEGKLKIWQTQNGEVRRELEGHLSDVYTCKFFPSGIVVLTGGADMQLKIWSAETGTCAATLQGHVGGVLDTDIVEKGRNIVSCSRDGTAKLYDVSEQKCLTTFKECGGCVNGCSLGVPENSLDLGSPDSPASDKEVSTEGKMLLLAAENKTLQAYGLHSRKKIFELDCTDAANCCTFLSDTSAVCGTQDGHITIVDLRNYRVPLKEWKEHRGPILSLRSYKQGFFVTTGDGSCFFVNELHDTEIELTGADCDPVYKVSHDGTNIFTSCRDGIIRKYKL